MNEDTNNNRIYSSDKIISGGLYVIVTDYQDKIVTINNPKDAVHECHDLFSANEYAIVVINLDLEQRIINRVVFPMINKTRLNIRHFFRAALICDANSFIVLMNQPSDVFEPSEQDKKLFSVLKHLGENLSVPLMDYIFFSSNGMLYSFANELTRY